MRYVCLLVLVLVCGCGARPNTSAVTFPVQREVYPRPFLTVSEFYNSHDPWTRTGQWIRIGGEVTAMYETSEGKVVVLENLVVCELPNVALINFSVGDQVLVSGKNIGPRFSVGRPLGVPLVLNECILPPLPPGPPAAGISTSPF